MTEELNVAEEATTEAIIDTPETELDSQPESAQSEPEYTDVELQAMEAGWKPKDQLEEGKAFVDAAEYLRRGELFVQD